MERAVVIGKGLLNWDRSERISDRYGMVFLFKTEHSRDKVELQLPEQDLGAKVKLKAKVIETRDSYHIGDLSHGVAPRTPKIGAVIELGEGFLQCWDNQVGVAPANRRDTLWLNLRALYDAHNQTVELFYEKV